MSIDCSIPLAEELAPLDADVACMVCRTKFSIWVRRHNCQFCGSLLCNECSSYRIEVKRSSLSATSHRSCGECFSWYARQQEVLARGREAAAFLPKEVETYGPLTVAASNAQDTFQLTSHDIHYTNELNPRLGYAIVQSRLTHRQLFTPQVSEAALANQMRAAERYTNRASALMGIGAGYTFISLALDISLIASGTLTFGIGTIIGLGGLFVTLKCAGLLAGSKLVERGRKLGTLPKICFGLNRIMRECSSAFFQGRFREFFTHLSTEYYEEQRLCIILTDPADFTDKSRLLHLEMDVHDVVNLFMEHGFPPDGVAWLVCMIVGALVGTSLQQRGTLTSAHLADLASSLVSDVLDPQGSLFNDMWYRARCMDEEKQRRENGEPRARTLLERVESFIFGLPSDKEEFYTDIGNDDEDEYETLYQDQLSQVLCLLRMLGASITKRGSVQMLLQSDAHEHNYKSQNLLHSHAHTQNYMQSLLAITL